MTTFYDTTAVSYAFVAGSEDPNLIDSREQFKAAHPKEMARRARVAKRQERLESQTPGHQAAQRRAWRLHAAACDVEGERRNALRRYSRILADKKKAVAKFARQEERKRMLAARPFAQGCTFVRFGRIATIPPRYTGPRDDIPRGVAKATSVKQVKQRLRPVVSGGNLRSETDVAPVMERVVRDKRVRVQLLLHTLATKGQVWAPALAAAILHMTACRQRVTAYNFRRNCKKAYLENQMSDAVGDAPTTGVAKTSKAANVVLSDTAQSSVAQAPGATKRGFLAAAAAKVEPTYKTLTDRWVNIGTFAWTTNHTPDTVLQSFVLPKDFLSKNITVNTALWKIHKYARPNFTVKICVNANKFQIGRLMADWYYLDNLDGTWEQRDNIYSASQRTHILIDAATANNAEMSVQYAHIWSQIPIKTNPWTLIEEAVMGRLTIRVLNALRCPDTVANHCQVSVFIRFDDVEFRGMLDSSLDNQMETVQELAGAGAAVAEGAATVLRGIASPRMDLPMNPLPPRTFQPRGSQPVSHLYGEAEQIEYLQESAQAYVNHPVVGDEMNLRSMLDHWGLVKQVRWSTNNDHHELLFELPVQPLLAKQYYSQYAINTDKGVITAYHIPPLGAISSACAYWSGDIEFRIDFICSEFHQGVLEAFLIPGHKLEDNDLTYDRAQSSRAQTLDLKSKVYSYVINADYIWVNALCPVFPHKAGELAHIPSILRVYVLNQLIAVDSVSTVVDINVYMRAGKNFTLSSLLAPALNPMFKAFKPQSSDGAIVRKNYIPFFTSDSRWRSGYLSLFWSETTDNFAQFTNLNFGTVYSVPEVVRYAGADVKFRIEGYVSTSAKQDVKFLVRMWEYDTYPVVQCFSSEEDAKVYAKKGEDYHKKGMVKHKQGPWCQYKDGQADWKTCPGDFVVTFPKVATFDGTFELLENQIGEETVSIASVDLETPAQSAQYGKLLFNEGAESAKDWLKRYTRVDRIKFDWQINSQSDLEEFRRVITFPLHPQTIFQPAESSLGKSTLFNLPNLLLSCFRFYRGSLRCKFVTTGCRESRITIDHQFDGAPFYELDKSIDVVIKQDYGERVCEGYPSALETTHVNPILTVGFPYRKTAERCLLQPFPNPMQGQSKTSIATKYVGPLMHGSSIGRAIITLNPCFQSKNNYTGSLEVFQSIGDDFNASNWCGFPPLIYSDELATRIENQGGVEKKSLPEVLQELTERPIENQGPIDSVVNSLTKSVLYTKADNTVTIVQGAAESLEATSSNLNSLISELRDWFSSFKASSTPGGFLDCVGNIGRKGFNIMSQIAHMFLHPSKGTIILAVVSIFIGLGIAATSFFSEISETLGLLLDACTGDAGSAFVSNQLNPENNLQNQSGDCAANYAAVLYTVLVGALKLSLSPPKDFSQFCDGLFKYPGIMARNGCFIQKFLSDNMTVFSNIIDYIKGKISRLNPMSNVLIGEQNACSEWLKEALALIDPSVEQKATSDPVWMRQVISCYVTSVKLIKATANDKSISMGFRRIMTDAHSKLRRMYDKIVGRGVFPHIRINPFCIFASGISGAGKTSLLLQLTERLVRDLQLGEHYETNSVFSITPGQEFFDGYNDHFAVMFDDVMSTSANIAPEFFKYFLQLKGVTPFNAPMAECERKHEHIAPRMIIVTSNVPNFENISAIQTPEAFANRCDLQLVFKDRRGNTSGKLRNPDYTNFTHLHVDVIFKGHKILTLTENVVDALYDRIRFCYLNQFESASKQFSQRMQVITSHLSCLAERKQKLKDYVNAYTAWESTERQSAVQEIWAKLFNKNIPVKELEKYAAEFQSDGQNVTWLTGSEPVKVSKSSPQVLTNVDFLALHNDWPSTTAPTAAQLETLKSLDKKYIIDPVDEIFFYSSDIKFQIWCEGLYSSIVLRDNKPVQPLDNPSGCIHKLFAFDRCMYIPPNLHTGRGFFALVDPDCAVKGAYIPSVPDGPCKYADCDYSLSYRKYYERYRRGKEHASLDLIDLDSREAQYYVPARILILRRIQKNAEKVIGTCSEWVAKHDNPATEIIQNEITSLEKRDDCQQIDLGEVKVNVFTRCLTSTKEFFVKHKKAWEIVGFVILGLVSAIALIAKILAVISFSKYLSGANEFNHKAYAAAVVGQMATVSGNVAQGAKSKVPMHKAGSLLGHPLAQAGEMSGISRLDNIADAISRNSVFLVSECHVPGEATPRTIKARGLGLYNNKAIFLRHQIEMLQHAYNTKGGEMFCVCQGNQTGLVKVQVPFDYIEDPDNTSMVLVTLPLSVSFKSLKSRIISQPLSSYPADAYLLEHTGRNMLMHKVNIEKVLQPIRVPEQIATTGAIQTAWSILEGFSYDIGGNGVCGSVLVIPALNNPIVGIHVAGKGTQLGYSEAIHRGMFFEKNKEIEVEFVVPQMAQPELSPVTLEGEGFAVGSLSKDITPYMSYESKIIPSELSGEWPVETFPAPLSKFDERWTQDLDPLEVGVAHRMNVPKEFPEELVQEALEDYKVTVVDHLKPLKTPLPLRNTLKDAVIGVQDVPFMDPMDLETSEGFPWVKMRPAGCTGKKWLLDVDRSGPYPVFKGINPLLQSTLQLHEKMRERGLIPPSYYVATLKDARVKPGKNPRVFEMSPIELTIAQRQYYMDYFGSYKAAGLKAEHTIGININGPQWSELINKLRNFSSYILVGDYSKFGPRLHLSIMHKLLRLADRWIEQNSLEEFTDVEWRCREALRFQTLNALCVVRNLVMRFAAGMPSGNAFTVDINSHVNSIYVRIVYLLLAKIHMPSKASLYHFHKFVLFFSNGDDLIMAVKEEIIDWFNNETISLKFAEFGIEYTDALKTGDIVKYRNLEDCTYLKCSPVPHPERKGEWLASLEASSIFDCAMWVQKSPNLRDASLLNSEQSCRLAYGHGPKFYKFCVQSLTQFWSKRGVKFLAPTWAALDVAVWEGENAGLFKFDSF